MEQIKKRILDFQAVIIGDIPAVEHNDVLKYCYAKKSELMSFPKYRILFLMMGADRIHVFDTPFMLSRDIH